MTAVRLVLCAAVAVAVGMAIPPHPGRADVFVLDQGGEVVGELQNAEQSPRETYVVKTAEGVLVTLARCQVKQWLRPKPEEVEYEKVRAHYPDTPEGQWELAEWCNKRKLSAERSAHLQRVIELDPSHEKAHRALGHVLINGKWTTDREFNAKQGYRWYQGRWRTQQEIDILEEKRGVNTVEKEWTQKIERWSSWLMGERGEEAREALLSIKDPAAVKGLAVGIRSHRHPEVRKLLAAALARLGTKEAYRVLAASAIDDPVEDVRLSCLELLAKTKNRESIEYFVSRLRDKLNIPVNRAAVALKMMGDPSAVGPLIDALVTVHKFKIRGSNPGQMTQSFGTGPGGSAGPGGLSVGGGPKIVLQPIANSDVLDALVALTGQKHLGPNVAAWKTWYAAQRRQQPVDIRRDD